MAKKTKENIDGPILVRINQHTGGSEFSRHIATFVVPAGALMPQIKGLVREVIGCQWDGKLQFSDFVGRYTKFPKELRRFTVAAVGHGGAMGGIPTGFEVEISRVMNAAEFIDYKKRQWSN
jgi:hypothetical protein